MAFSLKIDGAGLDYRRYIVGKPVIAKSLNSPTLFDVELAPIDGSFVKPVRGDYFVLATSTNPTYYTGFVTNAPELEYQGSDSTQAPRWSYQYQLSSDEYLLNLNPIGFVPPYLNTSQGAILIDLAERLCPGVFDTTNIDAGQVVSAYVPDPTKVFSEIVAEFCDAAYFSFRAVDRTLYFNQVDDVVPGLIVNCNSVPSNSVAIQSSTNATPIVVTASGHGLSNGDYISVHGHLVNTKANGNWRIANVSGASFELVNSAGNGVGGATGRVGKFNPHWTPANLKLEASQNKIVNDCIVLGEVEPQAYVTEYFVGDGYTGHYPLLSSIYGIEGATLLDEVYASDDENKWTEVDTISDFIRVDSGYLQFLGGDGDLSTVYRQSNSPIPLEGNLRLTHGEFDFTDQSDGVIASLWTATPSNALTGCVYGLQCTAAGVVSTVASTTLNPIVNGVVDTAQSVVVTSNLRYVIRTLAGTDEIFRRAQTFRFLRSNGTVGEYSNSGTPSRVIWATYITEIEPTNGEILNSYTFTNSSSFLPGITYANYVPGASSDLHVTISNTTLSIPMQARLDSIEKKDWSVNVGRYRLSDGEPEVFNLETANGWARKIVGPNEIESYDNLSPAATIVVSGRGKVDRTNPLSSPKYNPGDASLEFFKDSTKFQTNIPSAGAILKLKYRRAGVAVGRTQNTTSIAAEAAQWGDDGLRTATRRDLVPAPRTSLECELAAAAIVEELGFAHYEGVYTQDSHFEFTGDPLPGTVLKFANLAADMPTDLDTEIITAVKTTLESSIQEGFTHEVTFGNPDRLKKLLSGFQRPIGAFHKEDTAEIPTGADLAAATTQIGALNSLWYPIINTYTNFGTSSFVPSTTLLPVINPKLISWQNDYTNPEDSFYTIEFGQAPPPSGGFEVRYADKGWGNLNNKNLIVQTSDTTFQLPKRHGPNGDYCFIRAYDANGLYSRYSSALRIVFPKVPPPTSDINGNGGSLTHPIFKAELPIGTDGRPNLNSSIYGIVALHCTQLPVVGWFLRNDATENPFSPIGLDNPGQYNITPTNDGYQYPGNEVFLPGNADITQSGFINFESAIPMVKDISLFFVWVRAIDVTEDDGLYLRLNIKDNLAPGTTLVPYGFYSRRDYLLTGFWQPMFTVVELLEAPASTSAIITPKYNLVIHNINASDVTLKFALPFLGTSFYNHSDIVLGASPDSPGLSFQYDNTGTLVVEDPPEHEATP